MYNNPGLAMTTVATSESFAPLIGARAHTLILGTMPGQKSLDAQQYYAHKRNALWPILVALATSNEPDYEVHQSMTYTQRCQLAIGAGFALWDVLASCQRRGSLDSNIVRHSEAPNDIAGLLNQHCEIETIVCNGRTADKLFVRHQLGSIGMPHPRIITLPSTSPAMASLSLQDKFRQWRQAITSQTTSD